MGTLAIARRRAPQERREQILVVAVKLVRKHGLSAVTRDAVAEAAGVAQGTVNVYFGSIAGLREEVMQRAVEERDAQLLAQGLVERHPVAMKAPESLRRKALNTLV